MVACSYHINDANKLIATRDKVIAATQVMLSKDDNYKLFTGKGGTKKGIQERIRLFDMMLSEIVAQ
jgi:hypothetical protein